MTNLSRFQRRLWMTLSALMALAVSTDPRLAHMSSCPGDPPPALAAADDGFGPGEPPCIEDDACLPSICACVCRDHGRSPHQGEGDSRSIFVSSDTIKLDLAALTSPASSPPIAPRTFATSLAPARPVAPPTAALLLSNHLLI